MAEIKKIEEVEKLLENYKKEEKEAVIELIKPFYEFYDFMLETHNKDFETVDEESSKFSEEIFPEYLGKMSSDDSPMKFMMEISGDIMKRYAEKYEYDESDKVKIAMTKYMELMFKIQMKK